jgi:hypothetical protein
MPKAKPVSLYPLTFYEALKHLVRVDPDGVGITPERREGRKRATKPTSSTKKECIRSTVSGER